MIPPDEKEKQATETEEHVEETPKRGFYDKTTGVQVVPSEEDLPPEESEEQEEEPEPVKAAAPVEAPDWYRALINRTRGEKPPAQLIRQPEEQRRPAPSPGPDPTAERVPTWQEVVDNPNLMAEMARRASREEVQTLRREMTAMHQANLREKYATGMNALNYYTDAARHNFAEIQRDAAYGDENYKYAANQFMFNMIDDARSRIETAVMRGEPLPDLSYLADPRMVRWVRTAAEQEANLPANPKKVNYTGVSTEKSHGGTRPATKARQYSADERRMMEKIGLKEADWDRNNRDADQFPDF